MNENRTCESENLTIETSTSRIDRCTWAPRMWQRALTFSRHVNRSRKRFCCLVGPGAGHSELVFPFNVVRSIWFVAGGEVCPVCQVLLKSAWHTECGIAHGTLHILVTEHDMAAISWDMAMGWICISRICDMFPTYTLEMRSDSKFTSHGKDYSSQQNLGYRQGFR